MAGRGCVSGRSKECNYIAVSGDSCRNGCEETADQPCPDRCFIPCRHWMADSGGTDIVAGMAAVPAAGSGISDAQLYITGTGGIRGRPSASDGWNLAGIWADIRRSDAGTHSCSVLCGVLLMRKKIRKQDSIPLVPFLLLGFVGRCGML